MGVALVDRITQLYANGNLEGARKEYADYSNANNKKIDKEINASLLELCNQWLNTAPAKEIYILRAIIYEDLAEYKKAIKDCNNAITLDAKYAKAYNNRGDIYAELEDYEKAIEDYSQAIELDFSYATAYYNLGNAYFNLHNYQKTIESYSQVIKLDPNYVKAYSNRGEAYFILEDYKKAIEDYTQAINIRPDYAEVYNSRGDAYFILENYEKAIKDYTQAINLKSDYTDAYYNRGTTYLALQEYEKAIEDFNRAIKLKLNYADAYYNRGATYLALQEYQKAIEDYSQAIKLRPDCAKAYNNRGDIYTELEDHQKAIEDYTQAIKLDPDYTITYINRGNAYSNLKNYEKAIEDYTQAINLESDYTDAYYNRGRIYDDLKDYKKAIDDYTQAISIKPDLFTYLFRGFAHAQLKDYPKAIEDYNKAIVLESEDWFIKYIQSLITDAEKEHYSPSIPKLKNIIRTIKETLLYEEEKITHYTGLNITQILIESNAIFRFSEGSFLNDTSEGQQLNEYLSLQYTACEKSSSAFVRKPFIGSFVQGDNSNDLTLWRMYGKENNQDAAGCALVLDKEVFLSEIQTRVNAQFPKGTEAEKSPVLESLNKRMDDIAFYHVCYFNTNGGKDRFSSHCLESSKIQSLNKHLEGLKKCVSKIQKEIDQEKKSNPDKAERLSLALREYIGGIEYLFKGNEYSYEREVRMVLSGIGVERKISELGEPAKVYAEAAPIRNALKQITIGPKAVKAEEWAAYFHYKLNPAIEKEDKVKIAISKLPYK